MAPIPHTALITFNADALRCLHRRTRVVHRQVTQRRKVSQSRGLRGCQRGAQAGQAIQQMSQQHPDWPRPGRRGLPIDAIRREQRDQVFRALDLFLNLLE